MSDLPDFSEMTQEEIVDWFLHNDVSALLAGAVRPREQDAGAIDQVEPPTEGR